MFEINDIVVLRADGSFKWNNGYFIVHNITEDLITLWKLDEDLQPRYYNKLEDIKMLTVTSINSPYVISTNLKYFPFIEDSEDF